MFIQGRFEFLFTIQFSLNSGLILAISFTLHSKSTHLTKQWKIF